MVGMGVRVGSVVIVGYGVRVTTMGVSVGRGILVGYGVGVTVGSGVGSEVTTVYLA